MAGMEWSRRSSYTPRGSVCLGGRCETNTQPHNAFRDSRTSQADLFSCLDLVKNQYWRLKGDGDNVTFQPLLCSRQISGRLTCRRTDRNTGWPKPIWDRRLVWNDKYISQRIGRWVNKTLPQPLSHHRGTASWTWWGRNTHCHYKGPMDTTHIWRKRKKKRQKNFIYP